MEIRQLRTLIAIAEQGTFAAAAERIHLTQSAVSQQIRALEEETGISLFDRRARPPKLNVNGLNVLKAAYEVTQCVDALKDEITGKRMTGTFILGAVRSAMLGILPQALATLKSSYPELHIRVVSGMTSQFITDVVGGRLDAAIVSGPIAAPADIRWYPYLNEPLCVIAPLSTEGDDPKMILESAPYVRYQPNVPLAHMIDSGISRMGIRVSVEMELDTIHAIVRVVANGLGVSVVPKAAIFTPMEAPVRYLPFGTPHLYREVGFIERAVHSKKPIAETLHAEICRLCEDGIPRPQE